ncbi:MAG: lysophospholipid acyltransferase family protein [Rikenellaceae bacterium]
MSKLLHKLQVNLLWVLSKFVGIFPAFIQNLISDFLCFVFHRIVRYRLKVVRKNLANSFPERSLKELRNIEKRFYSHLADVILETFIIPSFSEEEMKRRMVYTGKDEFEKAIDGKVAIAAVAHYGSWEYTIGYSLISSHITYGVYHPLKNRVMDEYYQRCRSRFKCVPLPMAHVAKQMIIDNRDKKCSVFALIADQTPPRGIIKNRFMFLNQPTAFFFGIERLALQYKLPVFFVDVKKVKRGYYTTEFIKIYDGVESVKENVITKRYVANLERMILRDPALWMWSHKRWKHAPLSNEKIVE